MYFFNDWLIPGFIWIWIRSVLSYRIAAKNIYKNILDPCKKLWLRNYKSHTSWVNIKILIFFRIFNSMIWSGRKEIECVGFLRMDLSWTWLLRTCQDLSLLWTSTFLHFHCEISISQWKTILNLISFTMSVSIPHLGSSVEIFVQSKYTWKLALVQETRKIYPESLPSSRCHFHIHYNQAFLIRARHEMAACKYRAVPESRSCCYLLNVSYEILSALNTSWNWEHLRRQGWVVCNTPHPRCLLLEEWKKIIGFPLRSFISHFVTNF